VICHGATKRVDVGEVNGHYFINNSSLGAYTEIVRVREQWRPRIGKWPAWLLGTLTVMRRFPILKLELEIEGRWLRSYAPLLFVGNNVYQFAWPLLGARARLDEGCLSLLLTREAGRLALLRSAILVLRGQAELAPEIETTCIQSLTVHSRRRRLRVAVDGEILRLKPPLRYRPRPQALMVRVPAAQPGD